MSIRLIKVSKNLNVGINSLVEFLHTKGINIEANPNAKIEEEQYELLIAEFGKDKNIRKEVEKKLKKLHDKENKKETVAIEGYELPETETKKKVEKETIKTEIPEGLKPHINIVGNIDLDEHKKKKETKVEEKEIIKEAESTIEPEVEMSTEEKEEIAAKTKTETQKVKVADEQITIEEKQKEKQKKKSDMETKVVKEEVSKEKEASEEKIIAEEKSVDNNDEEDEVFRIHNKKLEPNLVIKGSIDLDAINEKTRPARKSRSQRRKERLEREQKALNSKRAKEENIKLLKKESLEEKRKSVDELEEKGKKKRKRIRKSKVNIDKTNTFDSSLKDQGRRRPILRKPNKTEVSDEEVQKQIKETLARLTEKRGGKTSAKYRREKREAFSHKQQEKNLQKERESHVLELTEFVTANDLANMMDIPVTDVISTCMSLGIMVAINQRLDAETINIVADEFGFKTKFVSTEVIEAIAEEEDDPKDLIPRPPIVTVMGHVDHGKTSLLDNIRNTNVIAGEAGGITQHIGAYNVQLSDGRKITFLDTPGHEAFTAMRARGAQVTDVAIIIVAADDDIMPQTVEAINHAKAAGVPIVFAINKIDKPEANPNKIKEKLAEMNYLVEEWGGKYQSQDISAKKGTGVQELLEKVLLEADLLELKANPNRKAKGSVIESSLDKGRGYVATVLVQNGTLKQGDIVLAGTYYGRIKAMFNERNQRIEKAGPSEPVLILGLNGAPQAGDTFYVMDSEQEARSIASRREQLQREQSLRTQKMLTLDDIGRRIAIGNFKQLNIIVKGDVDGSVEALSDSLIQLSTEEIQV
ncbi:MAG: translation initiation factor IF-2, partial [Bacteroidales bacterium]|nr:translation initiation factor IF-2 [Bacteroidales bacterium]